MLFGVVTGLTGAVRRNLKSGSGTGNSGGRLGQRRGSVEWLVSVLKGQETLVCVTKAGFMT